MQNDDQFTHAQTARALNGTPGENRIKVENWKAKENMAKKWNYNSETNFTHEILVSSIIIKIVNFHINYFAERFSIPNGPKFWKFIVPMGARNISMECCVR